MNPRIRLLALVVLALSLPLFVRAQQELSEDECLRFARDLEYQVSRGRVEALDGAIDLDAVYTGLMKETSADKATHEGALGKLRNALPAFGAAWSEHADRQPWFRFVRLRQDNSRTRALFRLHQQRYVDLIELDLSRSNRGIQVSAAFSFRRATDLVAWASNLYRACIRRESGKTEDDESLVSDLASRLDDILALESAYRAWDLKEVHRLSEQLPPRLKKRREIFTFRVDGARVTPRATFVKWLAEIDRGTREQAWTDCLLAELFTALQQSEEMERRLKRLEEQTGDSALTDWYRAYAYYSAGKLEESLGAAQRSVKTDPRMRNSWDLRLLLSLQLKQFDTTLVALRAMEEEFDTPVTSVESSPTYADFKNSEQGETWRSHCRDPIPASLQPAVTIEEATALAHGVEEAAASRDFLRLNALTHLGLLLSHATRGLPLHQEFQAGLRDGTRRSWDWWERTLCSSDASMKLLRVRERDGEFRPVFRFSGKGVDYLEFRIGRNVMGDVRIADIYISSSGDWISNTVRRTALMTKNAMDMKVGPIPEDLSSVVAMWKGVADFVLAARAGHHEEAVVLFEKLDPQLQTMKELLLQYVSETSNLGADAHEAAIERYRKLFPEDPALDLMELDVLAGKDVDKCLQAIERIDRSIGGDPYLKVVASRVTLDAGDLVRAWKLGCEALEKDPTLESAHSIVIEISLKRREFKTTVELLTKAEAQLGIRFDRLEEVDLYAEFVKSAEYAEWKQKRSIR